MEREIRAIANKLHAYFEKISAYIVGGWIIFRDHPVVVCVSNDANLFEYKSVGTNVIKHDKMGSHLGKLYKEQLISEMELHRRIQCPVKHLR